MVKLLLLTVELKQSWNMQFLILSPKNSWEVNLVQKLDKSFWCAFKSINQKE